MTKKAKTTLSDLNKFLSEEPNTLSKVEKISESTTTSTNVSSPLSSSMIVAQIKQLSQTEGETFGKTLMRLSQEALEGQADLGANELMLLNTLLFLQHVEKN